jgi:transcriptional regulator with PAS, ATPase and Fis domain
VMVQLKNIKSLSRIFQNLTGDQPQYTIEDMMGSSEKIRDTTNVAKIAAQSNAHVIIQGESGTGKEVLAQAIHNASPRRGQPFVVVNCAAIPAELLESTLFGHERGAFTGAVGTHIGKFELADGGTLFLDEIADMSLAMQAKILRVIEESKIERVGGKNPIPINVRILAATNRDLNRMIRENLFREDLFYRLNVFRIELPPLRERKEDILELVQRFVAEFSSMFQKQVSQISDRYIDLLMAYDWPGNIRELKNAIQYSIARMEADALLPSHVAGFFTYAPHTPAERYSLKGTERLADLEKQIIVKALRSHHGNKAEAAKALGIGRATLYRKLKSMSHMDTEISN